MRQVLARAPPEERLPSSRVRGWSDLCDWYCIGARSWVLCLWNTKTAHFHSGENWFFQVERLAVRVTTARTVWAAMPTAKGLDRKEWLSRKPKELASRCRLGGGTAHVAPLLACLQRKFTSLRASPIMKYQFPCRIEESGV